MRQAGNPKSDVGLHPHYNGRPRPIRLSLKKGERSTDVTWIGVKFKLVAPDYDYLMVTLPERFMDELRKQLEAWDRKGMIGVSELRQAAGRVWVTSTLYAVLYSHEADQSSGAEAERRAKRQDDRPRDHDPGEASGEG